MMLKLSPQQKKPPPKTTKTRRSGASSINCFMSHARSIALSNVVETRNDLLNAIKIGYLTISEPLTARLHFSPSIFFARLYDEATEWITNCLYMWLCWIDGEAFFYLQERFEELIDTHTRTLSGFFREKKNSSTDGKKHSSARTPFPFGRTATVP